MAIVVGTPRILADLSADGLLEPAALLPGHLFVPDVMVEDALRLMPGTRGDLLRRAGCRIVALDGAGVAEAFAIAARHRLRVAAGGAFALAFAASSAGILLADEDGLRLAAREEGVRCRDREWVATRVARDGGPGRRPREAVRSAPSRATAPDAARAAAPPRQPRSARRIRSVTRGP